jgi:exopolysaccharide/PEP-CTERM locus tyrosine autokinase
MSIFEKAFEKSDKSSGKHQAEDLPGNGADDFMGAPVHPGGGGPARVFVESGDSAGVETGGTQPESWHENLSGGDSGKLVELDLSRLRAEGLVDPRSTKVNRITEEFRRIKRPLLMNVRGEGASVVPNANMIMVSSALAGEGKTFTSINLAMSIAMEMDKTVLLVDADVAKPDVTARLGVQAEKGLIDVLLDNSLTLPDVLLRTDIPTLTLLPSGSRHVHSTELLASERMRQLTLELSSRYPDRVVIFDSPPLLLTSESRVLAGLMGQVLVVVEESITQQHAVKEAVESLQDNEIVCIVMNKGAHASRGDGYGYYGYYPYGQKPQGNS